MVPPKLIVDTTLDAIDQLRLIRLLELSDIKQQLIEVSKRSDTIASKAAVLLAYSHWEGFFNDCIDEYFQFLRKSQSTIKEFQWVLLIGVMEPQFNSLRDKNHSYAARRNFINELKSRIDCSFEDFDVSVVKARSNLTFARLEESSELLHLSYHEFQRHRLRIDKELVGWRNSVAHGASPDLSQLDISDHLTFTSQLMLLVADAFQEAIIQ